MNLRQSSQSNSKLHLIPQVSQLMKIPAIDSARMQDEILWLDTDVQWTQTYSEYQSGGWKTLSLYNNSGRPEDANIADGRAIETSLLKKLPNTRKYIESLNLDLMWVRLAKLEANSFLWEHRDYAELNHVERLRLHIPLITNTEATLVIGGCRVHLANGYVWKLNPTHYHAASNLGRHSRIHILIDTYSNEALTRLIQNERLDLRFVQKLKSPTTEEIENVHRRSIALSSLGYVSSAEKMLLKMYHSYHLADGQSYDLVSEMYRMMGNQSISHKWQGLKHKYLGIEGSLQ